MSPRAGLFPKTRTALGRLGRFPPSSSPRGCYLRLVLKRAVGDEASPRTWPQAEGDVRTDGVPHTLGGGWGKPQNLGGERRYQLWPQGTGEVGRDQALLALRLPLATPTPRCVAWQPRGEEPWRDVTELTSRRPPACLRRRPAPAPATIQQSLGGGSSEPAGPGELRTA